MYDMRQHPFVLVVKANYQLSILLHELNLPMMFEMKNGCQDVLDELTTFHQRFMPFQDRPDVDDRISHHIQVVTSLEERNLIDMLTLHMYDRTPMDLLNQMSDIFDFLI